MKILSDGNSFVWAVHLVVDEVWDNQRTRQIYYICSECSTLFLKSFTHQYQTSHLFPWQTANWHYKTDTTDELTFELISNVFFYPSAIIWCLANSIFLPKVYAIFNDVLSVWRDHYFAVLLNLSHKHIFLFSLACVICNAFSSFLDTKGGHCAFKNTIFSFLSLVNIGLKI